MNYAEMGTTALGKLVAERTGMPCNSRNKPALVRKLEKMDAAAPEAAAAEPVAEAPPASAPRARKPKLARRASSIHSDPALHAPALAYVRRAMARKQPPSLRALCAEMNAKGIKTPWGRKQWWPASVQNLIRQIAKEA